MSDLPGKSISISTDVFARIWSLRLDEEETENDILRRVLRSPASMVVVPNSIASNHYGFKDHRYGVSFDEGFEIFRRYRGTEVRAKATFGKWLLLNTGTSHDSLNALSRAIGAISENAWVNWFYWDSTRGRRPLSELRIQGRIIRRKNIRSKSSPESGMRGIRPTKQNQTNASGTEEKIYMRQEEVGVTWFADVLEVLGKLNRKAPLNEIYDSVEVHRKIADRSTPPSLEAIVRRTLEENCSDTLSYKGGPDVFSMPDGIGAGVWTLR